MTTIDRNIYDLMILQSIAETKLNRIIRDPYNFDTEENPTRFWSNYLKNNKSMEQIIDENLENSLLKQLQVSVGAIKSLDPNL